MRYATTKNFDKQFARLNTKLKNKFIERIELFLQDSGSKQLNNHVLLGKYAGYYSINVTGDVRALYVRQGEEMILFAFIGTHSQLYGK